MQKTNLLMKISGIMTALGSIPIIVGTIAQQTGIHIQIPNRVYAICVFIGAIGVPLGIASAKGQDEHSTVDQVQQATQVQKVNSGAKP